MTAVPDNAAVPALARGEVDAVISDAVEVRRWLADPGRAARSVRATARRGGAPTARLSRALTNA
jgi:hypothetical protein